MDSLLPDQGVKPFSGSYTVDDVQFLLNPKKIMSIDIDDKEALIQSGEKHYSEMLSAEQLPDARYMALYEDALRRNAGLLHHHINILANAIIARPDTHESCTLISLARAGTPIGVLLKRMLGRMGIDVAHYSISIIRDRGIDRNALAYIHRQRGATDAIFVDGWTGKGAIKGELDRSLSQCNSAFRPFLSVVADPAGCADMAATCDDYVIPSGLLNSVVSGLISRSVLNDALVGPDDFHACAYHQHFVAHDRSNSFIRSVETATPDIARHHDWDTALACESRRPSQKLVNDLMQDFGIDNINRIKPGIAESTRAILRRVPEMVLVRDQHDPDVRTVVHLAHQAGVPVIERNLHNYRSVTIIRKIGGEQE